MLPQQQLLKVVLTIDRPACLKISAIRDVCQRIECLECRLCAELDRVACTADRKSVSGILARHALDHVKLRREFQVARLAILRLH